MDQVAILGQFADQGVDLPQVQWDLLAALQIAAHELVLAHAQLKRCCAGLVASCTAVLVGKRAHAHNAADTGLCLTMVDRITDSADIGAGLGNTLPLTMPLALSMVQNLSGTSCPQFPENEIAVQYGTEEHAVS